MKAYVGSMKRYSSTNSSIQHRMRSCPDHFTASERNLVTTQQEDGQSAEAENVLLLP